MTIRSDGDAEPRSTPPWVEATHVDGEVDVCKTRVRFPAPPRSLLALRECASRLRVGDWAFSPVANTTPARLSIGEADEVQEAPPSGAHRIPDGPHVVFR